MNTGNEISIAVRGLTVGWERKVLLRKLTFDVRRSDIFVVLGGSGCGKSTLMRHLIGLETPLAGSVTFSDTAVKKTKSGRPAFGVMFQSGALLGSFTVGENVALQLQQWTSLPRGAIDTIVRAKLRLVGLEGAIDKMPSELSGGMKKRAAIARAMALEPQLLFLDEPSAGLDPVTAHELDELILSLNHSMGTTIVIVTHDLDSIFKVAKRCIMLDREEQGIIAEGDPRKLRDESDDPRVRAFFHRGEQDVAGRAAAREQEAQV
jgi:phospholipid/cholesterol/gamma-HCH transport system ATP-binding protein